MKSTGNNFRRNLELGEGNLKEKWSENRNQKSLFGLVEKYSLLFPTLKYFNLMQHLVVFIFTLHLVHCNAVNSPENKAENNLLKGIVLVQANQLNQLNELNFELNGTWKSFTEGTATSSSTTYIKYAGSTGVWLEDYSGSSLCKLIIEFNSAAGYIITQNPPNGGGCYSNDTNKGLYSKTIFKKSATVANAYNTCEFTFGNSSVATAIAVDSSQVNISSLTTGCVSSYGASPWTRLEKVK
jgi:hypothetical protein